MIDTADPTVAHLLAACVANPDDLTAALVLADAIQEQGDEDRAECIRVQCELEARGFPAPNDERTHELARREHELLRRHERAWRSAVPCAGCGATGRAKATPRGGSKPCLACVSGDAGGLLREFAYGSTLTYELVRVRWRRGLIDRVEVPRLEDCFEDTTVYSPATDDVQDAGWQPTPWLRAVVTHHVTVREVVPMDREPQNHTREGDWFWVAQTYDDPPSHALPKALFDAVTPEVETVTARVHARRFRTREAAIAALGRAVVAVARG